MERSLLDQLVVPQPPYRMPRPLATLTAEPPPELEIPSSELELLPPEAPVELERPLALAEAIEQQGVAIAAIEQDERQKLEASMPPSGSTPEEGAQDSQRREEAMTQIAVAATEGVAEVRALAPEGKSVERMSTEEREANQALAARLRAERDQRRTEEERLRQERERQEERARKEDIEFKKSVTRSQTAAIKEDAVREEQKLEQGVEFEQPTESAAQRAARLGREALQALNDFKDAQERGAKPEEVEFARQRADIAQNRAEAAKRGEVAPEQGIDMAKVEAAQPTPAETPQDKKDQERATGEGMPEVPNITINRETPSGRIYGRVEQSAAPVETPPAKRKVRPTADELEEYQRKLRGEARSESAEHTPTPQEQLIAQLQERIVQLEAAQQPEVDEEPISAAGSKRQESVKPESALRTHEIGEQQGRSFWERWITEQSATVEDWRAVIAAILAKKWEGRLARRDGKIKKWEEAGRELSKKGALGMARAYLWHEAWSNYHKWLGRNAYKKQEAWNDERVRRENNRDEILNQGAAKIDRLLDSALERVDQYAIQREEHESLLNQLHEDHRQYTEMLAQAGTADERSQVRDMLNDLERRMKDAAERKRGLEARWQAERRVAAREQARKEELLNDAVRPSRTDTTPKAYDWLVQRKTRPGGSPQARRGGKGLPRHPVKSREAAA